MMEEEKSHIISERVFGSSRKIQLISLDTTAATDTTTTNENRTPFDSLLSAINHIQSPTNNMSIESLLHTNGYQHHRQSQSASANEISVSSLLTSDNYGHKRKLVDTTPSQLTTKKLKNNERSRLVCLHSAVAQKSYGSEKRFLCPPPIVMITPATHSVLSAEQRIEKYQLSMSVICDNTDKLLEQRSILDENQSCNFKYLHVTNTSKSKQFNLKLDLLNTASDSIINSFVSQPISIISKPSKKTSKTRNVSTCILANSPVSLFNRINSQTVRTKYMTSLNNSLCAKNNTWSPFDIIILNQPKLPQQSTNTTISKIHQKNLPLHITYGTEIILRDIQSGVTSPSLIIRKVDKGRIAPCAYGPVSQMQKIALQLTSSIHSQPIYLSASSINDLHQDQQSHTWLDYSPSRIVQPEKSSLDLSYEQVDDYLCWTIVGINQFEYEFNEDENEDQTSTTTATSTPTSPLTPPPTTIASPPRHITPLPLLTNIKYLSESHTLSVVGQHLIQAAPIPRLLDLWLGTHGPLATRVSQPPQPHTPHETHWSVELPSTQDLLVSNHDLLVTHPDGHRTLELDLLLVRQDGLVYHTCKALSCHILKNNDAGRWTVVNASSSSK